MKRITEGRWTAELLAKLKEELGPKYTVLKHSDRFTAFVPDFSVSNRHGSTLWFEVKVLEKPLKDITRPLHYVNKPAQLYLTRQLGGWYIVHDPFLHITLLTGASDIDLGNNCLNRSAAMREEDFCDLLLKLIKDKL